PFPTRRSSDLPPPATPPPTMTMSGEGWCDVKYGILGVHLADHVGGEHDGQRDHVRDRRDPARAAGVDLAARQHVLRPDREDGEEGDQKVRCRDLLPIGEEREPEHDLQQVQHGCPHRERPLEREHRLAGGGADVEREYDDVPEHYQRADDHVYGGHRWCPPEAVVDVLLTGDADRRTADHRCYHAKV